MKIIEFHVRITKIMKIFENCRLSFQISVTLTLVARWHVSFVIGSVYSICFPSHLWPANLFLRVRGATINSHRSSGSIVRGTRVSMERVLPMTVSIDVFVFAASLQFRMCLFRVVTDLHVSRAQQKYRVVPMAEVTISFGFVSPLVRM